MSGLNTRSLDCEGLRGSRRPTATQYAAMHTKSEKVSQEQTPRPATVIETVNKIKDIFREVADVTNPMRKSYSEEVEMHHRTSSQRLHMHWAKLITSGVDGLPPHIYRESARLIVGELYPRLLYAFSDVVCYVTTNLK
jgi:hypothetical protein